jgi:RHS repeat-associated protein
MFTDRLFTGQREVAGLGIYHYGARFYSPKLGRFLSADPMGQSIANPQGFNRYSYALNNPVRYTDPTGYWVDEGCGTSMCSDTTTSGISVISGTRVGNSSYEGEVTVSEPALGVDQEQHERLTIIQQEAEYLSRLMEMGDITDVEALAMLLGYAAPMYNEDVDAFLTNLGIVVGGLDTTIFPPQVIGGDNPLSQYYVGYPAFDPDITGFNVEYNSNNENQVRHFLAGASGGNLYGGIARPYLLLQERAAEDRALYERAFEFVDYLNGDVPLNSAGEWVQNNLGP